MAKANPTSSISPFPPDIDRDSFGHWFSGFTDGEGCFHLALRNCPKTNLKRPCAQFIITLRADDFPVLVLTRSFLQCGRAYVTYKRTIRNPHSVGIFAINSVSNLAEQLIPHFLSHPLRAKKARDFDVFRRAVLLMQEVGKRSRIGQRVGKAGQPYKWKPDDIAEFFCLLNELRNGRQYSEPEQLVGDSDFRPRPSV